MMIGETLSLVDEDEESPCILRRNSSGRQTSSCFSSKTTQKEMVITKGKYNRFCIVASEPLSFNHEDWNLIPRY